MQRARNGKKVQSLHALSRLATLLKSPYIHQPRSSRNAHHTYNDLFSVELPCPIIRFCDLLNAETPASNTSTWKMVNH